MVGTNEMRRIRARRQRATGALVAGQWAALAAGVAVVGVSLAAILMSPALTVRSVRLTMPALPQAHEERATREACRLPKGTSLALMSVVRCERALMRLPWVRSVEVSRLPNRVVRARVWVRHAVATLHHGGRRWEIDEYGWVVRPARRSVGLPEITIEGPLQVALGKRLTGDRLVAGLAAAAMARDSECLRGAQISVDQTAGICFNNWDRVAVVVGTADDLPRKLAVVRRIYELEPDIGLRLSEIDVSCPRFPAGRPRVADEGSRPGRTASS